MNSPRPGIDIDAASAATAQADAGAPPVQTEQALQQAALAVLEAEGAELVPALTRYLATILQVDMAVIGVVEGEGEPGDDDERIVTTLGVYCDGDFGDDFSYPLHGTPCRTVLDGFRCYRSGLADMFPQADFLRDAKIDSYAGYPLTTPDGRLIGLIAVLARRPLDDESLIESMLRICGSRAADEIQRRRAEAALRSSEASYRAIFDASEDALFVHDWDTGAIVDVNPKACRSYGYTAEEMRRLPLDRLGTGEAPYSGADAMRMLERAKAGAPVTFEWRRRNRDGSLHWDEVHIKPAEIAGKRRVLAFTREITERKLAEEALRNSEEQYRSIFNASVDGLLLSDSAGRVVDVNEAFLRMYGFDFDEIVGKECKIFVPEERHRDCRRMVRAAVDGRPVSGETIGRRRDGSRFEVEVHAVPMQYRNEPHVLAVMRDLTERKREDARRAELEAQLRQAQKMEAIGHLTGGIAHDFNNLLAAIMGYVGLAIERQAPYGDTRLAKQLEQAHLSCERARDLIRQMLTFSRGQRGEPRPVALGTAIGEATQLLRASLPATIQMRVDCSDELPAVLIDPVQLDQVLMNLCINARDALHGIGTLRVSTDWRSGWNGVCSSCRQSLAGDFVELSVTDNGPGISAEVLDRIFEPFFSTKEVGQGSGMGLATVHGIVHEHSGHIVVDTTPGFGTRFVVLLPPLGAGTAGSVRDLHRSERAAAARVPEVLRGRVLLVDDEAPVLGFMRELLENWGLDVTALADPESARQLFVAGKEKFDLLLADQTMPQLTGTQLARSLSALRPGLPIVLYSGYREAVGDDELAGLDVLAVLEKPVDPAALHRLMRAQFGCVGDERPAA